MQARRRQLLQCSLSLPLCLPSVLCAKDAGGFKNNSDLNFIEIQDNLASPLLDAGNYLLVDKKVSHFQGEGIYLYPDWGHPRAYTIKKEKGGELSFYYPGQAHRLWSMTVTKDQALFSGRAQKVVNFTSRQAHQNFLTKYDELLVPAYSS